MQITDHSSSGATAKSIQLANLAFNFHHPDSPSFSYNKTQALSPQQYRISINPENYPSHTTPDCLLQRNGYSIHLVNSLKQRIKATTLIKRMYASRGYNTDSASVFSHKPNELTFLVLIQEVAAGTVTLRSDSRQGLLADRLYRDKINEFRQKGRKVCELSRFAIDPQYSSKEMTASLFQIAYTCARNEYEATDFFCEVNPRHAAPQKRMFGFQQIGEERTCPRVNAPAVLLHLELEFVKQQINTLAGSGSQNTNRSLYPHCLPFRNISTNRYHYKMHNNQVTLGQVL